MWTDSPSARRSKWRVTAQLIICIPWNIDFTTCADILMQHDFHTSAVGTTEDVPCFRNSHAPPEGKRRCRWCPMTHKPLTSLAVKLIETNGFDSWKTREQKVMFPFQIRVSAFYSQHASVIWKITGYHLFQFHHCWTRQTVAGVCNNYPKGARVAWVITHWAAIVAIQHRQLQHRRLKFHQRCDQEKPSSGSSFCFLAANWNKFSIITPTHFLDVFMFIPQVPLTRAQPAHPKHISHTNAHLSHCSGPLHHRHVGLSLLECPALLGEDKQILWFPCILQSPFSVVRHIKDKPSTGGFPLAQRCAPTKVWWGQGRAMRSN